MALDFASGCLGGIAGIIVGYPLDTCKVHLQTLNTPDFSKSTSTYQCLREITIKESYRGLFRGMSSPMTGVAVINAIVFGIYGNVTKRAENPNSLYTHFVAGCIAGGVQSFACCPIELIKTKMQIQESLEGAVKHHNSLQCVKYTVRTEGIRGLFRGLKITTIRDVPAFSSYFVAYEFLTQWTSRPTSFHILVAGGLAGQASWLVTYPFDVIKSRLQADGLEGPSKYKGIVDCVKKSYQSEGIGVFSKGLAPTLIRAFPSNAVCFMVVDWTLRLAELFHVSIEIRNPEPIALIGASFTPICHPGYHLNHHISESPESQRKRSHVIKSLIFFGAFSEAVCRSEMIELGNSLYDDEYNYTKIGDDISPVLSDFDDDTILFLNQ